MKLTVLRVLAFGAFACLAGCGQPESPPPNNESSAPRTFVGREACRDCHEKQYDLYVGSDHDMAMDTATVETVLGDFDGAAFIHHGVTSRFSIRDSRYFVTTEGPDGALQEFEIAYVFGIRPLQQYVVTFPNGRYQMLPLCWDTRPAEEGGQQWFHIYGDERIAPNDILFWTRMTHNWNYMCSECHSTRVRKNYDRFSESYTTTWSEIDVSCEACHGPGSEHVAWAEAAEQGQSMPTSGYLGLAVRLKDTDNATWVFRDAESGTAERTVPRQDNTLVEMCARCHSRRTILHEEYEHGKRFLDTHRPSVLTEELYFADGQILDEVYVYGSFLQSKMYMAGVNCKDCHEPHSGQVYVQGNALCYRCHTPQAYGGRSHHFHDPEQSGGSCVECHMPERTYMQIDPRRDHSMRVPRPDLAERLESPDACTACHDDKTHQWSARYTRDWYGKLEDGETHYGEIFYAGRRFYPETQDDLIELANDTDRAPMVRATAIQLLRGYPSPSTVNALKSTLTDPDPLIRLQAVEASHIVDASQQWPLLRPLLTDSVRAVRVHAAQALSGMDRQQLSANDQTMLQAALEEYKKTQYINADHQTAHLNLGVLASNAGEFEAAEAAYRKAIEIEPLFPYAYINLADLYRQQGREQEAERVLRSALKHAELPQVHHALGLSYVRQRRNEQALTHLHTAAELAPEDPHFSYVYAIALNSTGEPQAAIRVLKTALQQHPYNRNILYVLTTLHAELQQIETALEYAEKLVTYFPEVQSFQQLQQQLHDALQSSS